MMKLNKVIALSLSLVLVPALSFSSPFTESAARYGRTAAFHASRFVAARLVTKAINGAMNSKTIHTIFDTLGSPLGLNGGIKYDAAAFARFASAALTPKAFNKITVNAKSPMVKFFAPQSGQVDGSGRIAFWAGLASNNLLRQLDDNGKLPGFLSYLA